MPTVLWLGPRPAVEVGPAERAAALLSLSGRIRGAMVMAPMDLSPRAGHASGAAVAAMTAGSLSLFAVTAVSAVVDHDESR
jgi:hypothetical protein